MLSGLWRMTRSSAVRSGYNESAPAASLALGQRDYFCAGILKWSKALGLHFQYVYQEKKKSWKCKITSARNLEVEWVSEPSKGNPLQSNMTHISPAKKQPCTFLPGLFLTSLDVIQVWISQKQFCKCESQKTGAPGCLLYSCETPRDGHRLFHSRTAYVWNAVSSKGDESPARQIKVKPSKYMRPFSFSSSSENTITWKVYDQKREGQLHIPNRSYSYHLNLSKGCVGSLEICHEIKINWLLLPYRGCSNFI